MNWEDEEEEDDEAEVEVMGGRMNLGFLVVVIEIYVPCWRRRMWEKKPGEKEIEQGNNKIIGALGMLELRDQS